MGLYRRPDSQIWYLKFKYRGTQHRRSTGETSRRAAEAAARRIRADIERDADDTAAAEARGPRATLSVLLELDVRRAVARGTGERQIESIEACWLHLVRHLGDVDASSITYGTFESYVAARRAEGVRGQSITKERQALARGMRLAKRHGYDVEPMKDWPEIRYDPPREAQRGHSHPPDVLARWLDALEGPARRLALVLVHTGLRVTEARRLTWSWVEDGRLRIPAAASKTRTERVVGLTDEALAALEDAAAEAPPGAPLLAGTHRKAWDSARMAIGYGRKITPRDLRHCHATLAALGSSDIRAVQAALGHSNVRTTSRYLHADERRAAGAAGVVATALRGHRGGAQPSDSSPRAPVEAMGFEPTTSCVQSSLDPLISEVLACPECSEALLEILALHVEHSEGGHREGAQAGEGVA